MNNKSIEDEKNFWEKQRTLSFEFSRYVLAHPDFADNIPLGAQIVFLMDNDDKFNERSRSLASLYKEKKQEAVFVRIDRLLPPLESRLINPHLETVKL